MNPDLIAERRLLEQKSKQRHILADRRRFESLKAPRNGQIRKVNFDDFKNHYDQNHAPVEVLVAGEDLMSEVREQIDHHKFCSHDMRHGLDEVLSSDDIGASPDNDTSLRQAVDEDEKTEPEGEIKRVRIHSLHVLAILTLELNIHTSWYWPRTFFRPFKAMVHLQPRLQDILAKWEAGAPRDGKGQIMTQNVESRDSVLNKHNVPIEKTTDPNTKDKSRASSFRSFPLSDNTRLRRQDYIGTVEAIDAIRVYLEFVDKEIMPLYNRFESGKVGHVAFDDLWSLFRLGELVHVPSHGKSDEFYHEVWRLYRVKASTPVALERQSTHEKDKGPRGQTNRKETAPHIPLGEERQRPPPRSIDGPETLSEQHFTLYCYHIDHDSQAFGAVRQKFTISYFSGERAIDSLSIFPLKFLRNYASKTASLKTQGQKFMKLLSEGHCSQSYRAWTIIRNPPCDETNHLQAKVPIGSDGEPLRFPEFIDSNVIVDMAEAFQTVPSWKPKFHEPSSSKTAPVVQDEDRVSIRRWMTRSKDVLVFETPEFVQTQDGIEIRQRNINLDKDSFLRSGMGGHRSLGHSLRKDYALTDDDLMLLPKRVFAYALRERKFVLVDLNFLEDIEHNITGFRSLQIPDTHKDVIRGLVSHHFVKRELERMLLTSRSGSISQDLLQDKGNGLVMLLHGAPGVGKTATAEAVAMEYQKPLFVVTCGALGLVPDEIERSITKIFRLADLWDCVLLLDEADVFLTRRTVHDVIRSAMVSVFLRVLEYHNGLLFLTTNRVGTIDEAFKSRIHMSFRYQALSEEQTVNIFRYNLDKLNEIELQRSKTMKKPMLDIQNADILEFARLHYKASDATGGCWNGRQIRNAFQIASSLAHNHYALQCKEARDAGNEEPAGPVLQAQFFQKVQIATQDFNEYMASTLGETDARRAYLQNERHDDFVTRVSQQQPTMIPQSAAGGIGASEYSMMGPRYNPTATHQPAVSWNTPQYSGVAQNLGQIPYQTQSIHPTSFFSPQAQINTMQPSQSYMPTQTNVAQTMGFQPVQTYAQPLAQSQHFVQRPMQQAQFQPFGQPHASPNQPVPNYMTTQGQPQASLYHKPGQAQLQNQTERQHIPSEMPQMAINAQPSLPNML